MTAVGGSTNETLVTSAVSIVWMRPALLDPAVKEEIA
jgi:hypothetical protein